MVQLRPFKARWYDPAKHDLAQVLTPPYDVISAKQQAGYYAKDPHSFIRVDFGQTQPGDSDSDNVYTRAAATLQQWLAEGVFATAAGPGYYLHTQTFTVAGRSYQRSDLFALCEATPFGDGNVLPHEKTLDGPKKDRYALMEATQAHLSPVFSIYRDPEAQMAALTGEIAKTEPIFALTDEDGISHTVHAISDEAQIRTITEFFASRPLYIADGHHRYETAMGFRRANYPATEAAGYLVMYLSALEDPGLLVLPYHRLIRSRFAWPDHEGLFNQLRNYFHIQKIDPDELNEALRPEGPHEMRLAMETPEGTWVLQRNQGLPEGLAAHRAASYRSLDVSVLHELLLYKLAGFPADKAKDPDYIQFSPDVAVLRETLEREGGVAFYLNPTPVSALCAIAEEGETMPPKSTYFYPKVPSGLLFTRFDSAF